MHRPSEKNSLYSHGYSRVSREHIQIQIIDAVSNINHFKRTAK